MTVNPLSAHLVNFLSSEPALADVSGIGSTSDTSFSDILAQSLDSAAATDTADKVSSLELLTGQSDDLSSLMLDVQKAELSLSLALQLRNKVVEAYNEIMRMQV